MYQEGRIHTFADILLRYKRYAFVISGEEIPPEIWSHSLSWVPTVLRKVDKQVVERKCGKCFSDKMSSKIFVN